jgi:hypothetical protein
MKDNNRFRYLSPEPMPSIPEGTSMPFEAKTAREIMAERRNFKRDRVGHNGRGMPGRITYMAHASGYVMCRRPGCIPFVISEADWRSFPFWKLKAGEADSVPQ